MINLIHRRVVAMLAKEDGNPMLERMGMTTYIDAIGEPLLNGPERPVIPKYEGKIPQYSLR